MNRLIALRIVRMLMKAYEDGDDDDTLAWKLQRELQAEAERIKQFKPLMRTKR